jgi:hypothetical protein
VVAPVVKVRGLSRLTRTMKAAEADLSELNTVHAKVAALVAASAASRAPRRSGRLAASVRGSKARRRASVTAGYAKSVPYAGPIHWGWPARNIEPQPFIYDAAQSTETAWLGVYTAGLNDIIDRVQGA